MSLMILFLTYNSTKSPFQIDEQKIWLETVVKSTQLDLISVLAIQYSTQVGANFKYCYTDSHIQLDFE
eukprot:m.84079 g.84079  ORF g.84079 m.84079 type:complete len:68 (+) comp36382_c0_seq2:739-942(+)